jgi:hypothetical protein
MAEAGIADRNAGAALITVEHGGCSRIARPVVPAAP